MQGQIGAIMVPGTTLAALMHLKAATIIASGEDDELLELGRGSDSYPWVGHANSGRRDAREDQEWVDGLSAR